MRSLLCALLVAGTSSIVGCDLVFESQDVVIKHDVAGDALDVLFVYHGISAGGAASLPASRVAGDSGESADAREDAVEKGVAAVNRLVAGDREGMIVDWPLHVALDKLRTEDEATLSDPRASTEKKADATARMPIYDLVTMVDCGAFLDESKRLCGFQRLRIHPLSKFESLLNARFDASAREAAHDVSDRDDAVGVALRAAKADAKTPWFHFEQGALRIEIPMSMAERAEAIREATEKVMKADERTAGGFEQGAGMWNLLGEWLATAPSVALEKEAMRVTFGGGGEPIHWSLKCPDRAYDPALLDALKAGGVKLRDDVKAADLIASMK